MKHGTPFLIQTSSGLDIMLALVGLVLDGIHFKGNLLYCVSVEYRGGLSCESLKVRVIEEFMPGFIHLSSVFIANKIFCLACHLFL